jgi:hypothetical protein
VLKRKVMMTIAVMKLASEVFEQYLAINADCAADMKSKTKVKKKKDDEDGEGNFDNFVDFRDVPRFS